jgi:nanoRNase/pAp phosphatase (c-di-AMP/oligoRNAs hydrolase)
MAFDELQQLHRLVEESKHILLTLGAIKSTDSVCAALAFKRFLEKQHKQADIVVDCFQPAKNLLFLEHIKDIKPSLHHLQKFIIKIDLSHAKIDTLSYDIKDDWLSVYITPKEGTITKNELRTAQSSFKYDLIITFGAQDLESMGNVFLNNTDLFFRVPVVNFDSHPANEHFGQINNVDLSATSTCEIIFKTMENMGGAYIDEEIATALLTGMISSTQSFKTANVKPHTLGIAGRLMNLGADRDKIIKNLYRTRSIATLKLWGMALTHLESDSSLGIVWTSIAREEFARAGAFEEDIKDLAEELIGNAPEAKVVILIYENNRDNAGISGYIFADRQYDAKLLVQPFSPEGDKKTASFNLPGKTLKEAEKEIIENVKKIISGN